MSSALIKVLLVDDIDANLLALELLLRRPKLEIHKARSGSEALELLLQHEYALAILDVQMPGMDGFELAEVMQGSERTQHVPIIFLTAGGLDEQRKYRGYGAGAVDFLFKPLNPQILEYKADVFFTLYEKRQEVVRQKEELEAAAAENRQLLESIREMNEGLEQRVQERTNQLLEANEQLQGFTYSVAHDFRQHLRGINVNASIMLKEMDCELGEYRPHVERIVQVCNRMAKMADDMLTYARVRTEALNVGDVDLSEMAHEIGETWRRLYPQTEVRVQEGMRVQADKTLLRVVLECLIDNAFKYSHKVPSPLVEVGQDSAGVFVRDNGLGFEMTYGEKIFEPFERLHADGSYEGTGIGLANVKRIIDRHGGRVWAESEPGAGATFRFCLG
jgi:two-component system, sensor histidine kinase and response regulator